MIPQCEHTVRVPLAWLLILLFAGSIFWINFHSAFWYDMDMALNAHVAKLMWCEKTFFPENWIFGNSYFILETSNLAALFYGLTHHTTLAMSLASSLWVFILTGTFIWSLKPFVQGRGIAIGTLCLIGGIIFGTSAASYTKGLQVLYTMASYYACYLEVLLLSLGAWLRLYSGRKLHWVLWVLVLLLNFAVGMHSLREMLILGIPLSALSVLLALRNKEKTGRILHATLLAFLILAAEGAAYLFMQQLEIPVSANIGNVAFEAGLTALPNNFLNCVKNVLRISGIAFIKDGIIYLPLFFCAIFVAAAIVLALIDALREKIRTPLSTFILFTWLSLLSVFGVGVFLLRTRDVYFFVYWLLATLSIVYLITRHKGKLEKWLIGAVCLIAAVNYSYNFIPDFIDHHRHASQMAGTTQWLIDEGYTTLYGDDCAVFAAASKDRITATPIRLDFDENSTRPLVEFPYNRDVSLYDKEHQRQAVVCLSNYYLDSERDEINLFIRKHASAGRLKEFSWGKRDFLFLKFEEGSFSHD